MRPSIRPRHIVTLLLIAFLSFGMSCQNEQTRIERARDQYEQERVLAEQQREEAEASAQAQTTARDNAIEELAKLQGELTDAQKASIEAQIDALQAGIDADIAEAKRARDARDAAEKARDDAQRSLELLDTATDAVSGDPAGAINMVSAALPPPFNYLLAVGAPLVWGEFQRRGKGQAKSDGDRERERRKQAEQERDEIKDTARTAMQNLDRASTKDEAGNRIVNSSHLRTLNGSEMSRRIERLIAS